MAEVVGACAGTAVLTAWGIYIGASPLIVGLLASLTQCAQLIQFPAAWLTSTFGPRRTCIVTVGLSRQLYLLLAVLPLLQLSHARAQSVLLAVATASTLLAVVGNNSWVAWMGDLVPKRIMGRYFGRRTAICTAAAALGGLAAGTILDVARSHHLEGACLAALALLACVAGAISTWLMIEQGESTAPAAAMPFDWHSILRPWRDAGARSLLVYQVAWNGAVGLAGSFFTVFMLEQLHLGFSVVALHAGITAFVRVLVAPLWGAAIDRFGARPVLVSCSFAIAILPLLWLTATPDSYWMIWCDPPLSGVLWGGQAQAIFHLPLAVAPRRERPFYLAAFAMAAGVAFGLATAGAGMWVTHPPAALAIAAAPLFGYRVLFAASALARFGAALLSRRITEPGAHPTRRLMQELMRPARQTLMTGIGLLTPSGPR